MRGLVAVAALAVAGLLSGCVSLDEPGCVSATTTDRETSGSVHTETRTETRTETEAPSPAAATALDQPRTRTKVHKVGPDDDPDLRTPWVMGDYLETDPSTTWDTVYLQTGDAEMPMATARPPGWSVETERLSDWGDADFSILRVKPGDGMGHVDLDYGFVGDCGEVQHGTLSWELDRPDSGRAAEPGQGVHVYTAGFWENGTLFYTNIKEIDHDDWPRAAWYQWEGGEPLPVYVYDQDRDEEPLWWHPSSSLVPYTGTPVDPVAHGVAMEADQATGVGYFTTIPGFNEALKGLSTNTVHVVRLEPEQAYTRDGNEDHPLYGAAIVFYIKLVDVVDLPCPTEFSKPCGMGLLAE